MVARNETNEKEEENEMRKAEDEDAGRNGGFRIGRCIVNADCPIVSFDESCAFRSACLHAYRDAYCRGFESIWWLIAKFSSSAEITHPKYHLISLGKKGVFFLRFFTFHLYLLL